MNKDNKKHFFFGLGLGAISIFIIFITHYFLGLVRIGYYAWNLVNSGEIYKEMITGLLLYILVEFTEELLARGYFINSIKNNPKLAVITSALFFSVLHLLNPGIAFIPAINLFLVGVLFALMYIWSGSLLMPIGMHITWNYFLGNIFTYPVSGMTDHLGLIGLIVEGPPILTGGNFGPEGSIIVTGIIIIQIFFVKMYFQNRK